MKTVFHVVGARPNFMKAAPLIAALEKYDHIDQKLVHTGQHYDHNMSKVFFDELGIPKPDYSLEVGSGSHAQQTAAIMLKFEELATEHAIDLLIVYGDVNSTIATALVAAKQGIPIAHMEAGLRSFDHDMPEEINRILTDRISNLYFTPSRDGNENLSKEGVDADKIHLVGNVMIDTLARLLPQAKAPSELAEQFAASSEGYALVTLHRPSNVDEPNMLKDIVDSLNRISQHTHILFPVHPRTRARMETLNLAPENPERFHLMEPAGYLNFIWLQQHARVVLTDSGGVQEESTYLQVPCLTLRANTERPITCTSGTNKLIGQDLALFESETLDILNGKERKCQIPELWDGKTGERTADIISRYLQ
ncbi:MAG: UDP-N-acetylglucosamine 2-epimerase (non-hydrolyzing) [Pseudomonadota bacterium]